MKTITELVSLYEDFFSKLGAKINTPNDTIVMCESFDNPTDADIDALALKFNAYVPDDIRTFWKTLDSVYEASIYEDKEWQAGFDFLTLDLVARGTPQLRELAGNYEEGNAIKKLHETGVQLTYSEPILIFDANPKTNKGNIHRLLWDGDAVPDAIAPNFTAFFEHWLATGCFSGRDFKAYWEIAKEIVPIQIPLKDNLWLKYYKKQYANAVVE